MKSKSFLTLHWQQCNCYIQGPETYSSKDIVKIVHVTIFEMFVFFAHKKYSRSFIKVRLNHWCHMEYFNDVLANFLGLECCSYIAVFAGSESSWISLKNILICVLKMNEGHGLEWHEGE